MATASSPPRSRWRNPVFLLVFVPGALAWLTLVAWATWLYFLPVVGWVGGLNEFVQEIVGTVIVCAWAVVLAFGLAGVGALADWAAGTRTVPTGQRFGQHARWHPGYRRASAGE